MTGEYHVLPVEDLIEHERSEDCVCGPAIEPVERDSGSFAWVIVHNSLDGRELEESTA